MGEQKAKTDRSWSMDMGPMARRDAQWFANFTSMIIATTFINLFALAVPLVTLQVYDRILKFDGMETLQVLCFGVIVIVGLEITLKISRSSLLSWSSARFEHSTHVDAVSQIMNVDMSAVSSSHINNQYHRLSAIGKLKAFKSGQAYINLIDLPFVFIFLGFIYYLSPELAIVPALLLIAFVSYALWVGHALKQALHKFDGKGNERMNFISESLEKIHTVKMMGLEPVFERRHEYLSKNVVHDAYHLNLVNGRMAMLSALFTQISMVAMIALGAMLVIQGQTSMGVLIACALLSGRIMQPLHRALGFWAMFQDYQLAKRKVEQLFEAPVQMKDTYDYPEKPKGRIVLSDLCFEEVGSASVLRNINLTVEPGTTIALSGPSGDDKTNLLKLIAGLYTPDHGSVTVDQLECASCPSTQLVRHVGYLPSEAVIFQGSILDNLTSFRPELNDEARVMANYLGIDLIVSKLTAGYETILSDSQADVLTPGMKQRIAIARVLVNRPRVLLFDFADKSLDKDGYNHVFRLLGKLRGQVSMILASNDRNILHLAKKEYILSDGHLAEQAMTGFSNSEQVEQPFQELRA